jgi:hypothetical protein
MSSRSRDVVFYGNMKWFQVDQPESFAHLPAEFKLASDLLEGDGKNALNKSIDLLSPFVIARFLPSNISGWEEIFEDPTGEGFPEFDAVSVRLVGIDFAKDLRIPLVKAEALFRVPVTPKFNSIKSWDEWQDDNDYLYSAVVFGWNVEKIPETEGLDFMCSDNQGCECIPNFAVLKDDWPGL